MFGGSVSGACNPFQCGPLQIVLSRDDNGAFAFKGADISAWAASGYGYSGAYGIKVGGGYAEGAVGSGDWLNLEQVVFEISSSCSGSQCGISGQIDFDTLNLYIDNVSVSVVPIPAAAWLFGSALAGLGWLRRRSAA